MVESHFRSTYLQKEQVGQAVARVQLVQLRWLDGQCSQLINQQLHKKKLRGDVCNKGHLQQKLQKAGVQD
jgi:hypothetical protein